MQLTVFHWHGKEFVVISAEAKPGLPGDQAVRDLMGRFDAELKQRELSLDDAVRTRLWARDRESRDKASAERLKILSGKARSSSSSYISPGYFESNATVALSAWAMRPGSRAIGKVLQPSYC